MKVPYASCWEVPSRYYLCSVLSGLDPRGFCTLYLHPSVGRGRGSWKEEHFDFKVASGSQVPRGGKQRKSRSFGRTDDLPNSRSELMPVGDAVREQDDALSGVVASCELPPGYSKVGCRREVQNERSTFDSKPLVSIARARMRFVVWDAC